MSYPRTLKTGEPNPWLWMLIAHALLLLCQAVLTLDTDCRLKESDEAARNQLGAARRLADDLRGVLQREETRARLGSR